MSLFFFLLCWQCALPWTVRDLVSTHPLQLLAAPFHFFFHFVLHLNEHARTRPSRRALCNQSKSEGRHNTHTALPCHAQLLPRAPPPTLATPNTCHRACKLWNCGAVRRKKAGCEDSDATSMRDAWLHFVSWKTGVPAAHGAVDDTGQFDHLLGAETEEWLRDAREEHTRAMQMLLDAGASLRASDSDGNNAVMLAVKAGSPHAVEKLIAENTLRHRQVALHVVGCSLGRSSLGGFRPYYSISPVDSAVLFVFHLKSRCSLFVCCSALPFFLLFFLISPLPWYFSFQAK
jgi:hypothetical protein